MHWVARVILVALIVFEALGLAGAVPLTPEFTWDGLLWQAVAALVVFEIGALLARKRTWRINVGAAALLFALLTTADAIGDVGHLYGLISWYDQVMHFSGGFLSGWVATAAFWTYRARGTAPVPKAEIVIVGTSMAGALGALFELSEYYSDLLMGSQRLGDGFDTANDLSLDLFGGFLAALLVANLPTFRLQLMK